MKLTIEIPSQYGRPVFEISFDSKVGGKCFPKKSMPTAKEILSELGKFVEMYFFIISEVNCSFVGQFQRVWTRRTIVLPRKSKKDSFYFVEKINLSTPSEKKIQQILDLAKKGYIKRIIFTSPVYTEEIVYCHNPLWFHSLMKDRKSLLDGDIRIADKVFITYNPQKKTIFKNNNFWTVIISEEKWNINSLKEARFCSREIALELVLNFLRVILESDESLNSQIAKIIKGIEKIQIPRG